MGQLLQQRLHTARQFGTGERIMLALGLASADLGAVAARVFRRYDLSHTQYNVLRMLRGAGSSGLLHGEVGERLIMGVPDVTRLMDRLERRGLIERERLEGDRRKVTHRITSSGIELLERVAPELDRFHDWLAGALEPEAREALIAACERLIEFAERDSPWEEDA